MALKNNKSDNDKICPIFFETREPPDPGDLLDDPSALREEVLRVLHEVTQSR